MVRIHENLPRKEFTQPAGITTATVCKKSGKLAIEGVCDNDPRGSTVYTEYFAQGTVPTEYCDHHVQLNICSVSGMVANEYCPAEQIVPTVYIVGGSAGTWDEPYLATEEFLNTQCPLHTQESSAAEDDPNKANASGTISDTPDSDKSHTNGEPSTGSGGNGNTGGSNGNGSTGGSTTGGDASGGGTSGEASPPAQENTSVPESTEPIAQNDSITVDAPMAADLGNTD
jgi:penicillin-binding protein 1A